MWNVIIREILATVEAFTAISKSFNKYPNNTLEKHDINPFTSNDL
jgi:hypothetical protein